MQKLRLALVLPIAQVVVAAILLQWGNPHVSMYVPTPRLICWGLTAPAMLFRGLGLLLGSCEPAFPWRSQSVFGFYIDDIFFMAGVIVVWYFVGRALDQRRTRQATGECGTLTALTACTLQLVLWGLLFILGLDYLRNPPFNNPDYPVVAIPILMWSVGLIFLSGRRFVGAVRAFRGQ
jgi:hypothetical protein